MKNQYIRRAIPFAAALGSALLFAGMVVASLSVLVVYFCCNATSFRVTPVG